MIRRLALHGVQLAGRRHAVGVDHTPVAWCKRSPIRRCGKRGCALRSVCSSVCAVWCTCTSVLPTAVQYSTLPQPYRNRRRRSPTDATYRYCKQQQLKSRDARCENRDTSGIHVLATGHTFTVRTVYSVQRTVPTRRWPRISGILTRRNSRLFDVGCVESLVSAGVCRMYQLRELC